MTNKFKRINTIYTSSSQFKKLAQRTQQLNKLNSIVQQAMPPGFSAHCHLANVNEQTLIIHTDNANYASLLRFQAGALCHAVSEHLPQIVNKLEVKVRAKLIPLESESLSTLSLPNDAADALQQTADNMDDGALKTALEKLAKRKS